MQLFTKSCHAGIIEYWTQYRKTKIMRKRRTCLINANAPPPFLSVKIVQTRWP
jgi:hypothetical protein